MKGDFYIDELNSPQRPAFKNTETGYRLTYLVKPQYFTYSTQGEGSALGPRNDCCFLFSI
jgi:hypothetical protein